LDAQQILTAGGTCALFSNILTNLFKISPAPTSPLSLRAAAFVVAEVCAFLLFLTGNDPFTRQNVAVTVLIGVASFGTALVTKAIASSAEKV